ncbi:MAG: hypothetical protein CMLOHMNK_02715 [Steroidobacteraceae bacterium]|nr:hypothetical protein [Steroidobacteraceae bacterium]
MRIVPDDRQKPAPAGARRVAQIVHDDLGNARVEWRDIPDDRTGAFSRPTFEIEEYQAGKSHNPYERVRGEPAGAERTSTTTRTDLRKLSEWIKLKRELEARKKREEEDEK